MMMKRTSYVKKTSTHMNCFFCHKTVTTDSDVVSVLCGQCVARISDAPIAPKPVVTVEQRKERKAARAAKQLESKTKTVKVGGRGRGWHLKRAFAFEGQFYSFGQPVTEAEYRKLAKA